MPSLGKALVFCALALSGPARADEVQVAVAANFTAAAKLIAAGFERESGHRIISSFGSTGSFYAQIRNGAPFDMLLAADEETPARLVKEGSAVAGSQFTCAVGKLVLWSATPGTVDGQGEILKRGGFDHIAVTNPKLAPYGAAAVEAMKSLGVYDALQPRFVMAENLTQTYQFVRSGNAQLGFVALSQVLQDGKIEGSTWLVPPNLYPPIRQDAVMLEKGRGKSAVLSFMMYLKGNEAKAIIKSFGYGV